MKLSYVLVRDKHPSAGKSTYKTENGDEMSLEAGLVTIRTMGRVIITPASNVSWMEQAVEAPKAAKK